MKKKLSKVLAVVLSLVLAVGLAAVDGVSVAQAAKAKKIKLTTNSDSSELTSGQTVVIKAKGKNAKKAKWSIKGDTTFAELNKTKGNKVKLTVKENATGTVKVVAKVTKKNKASVSFTLSCEADAITVTDAEGFTNEAIALTTTPTPSNAKLGDVTYAVYTDETATTAANAEEVAVADGALTAKVAGTYYVIAKTTTAAGEISSPVAKVVVTDKLAQVTGVKQTHKNIIEVTFDADASKVATDDLVIVNSIGIRVNVKTIELDEAKTKATVTTLVNMADGKEYTVTYKESSEKFTATTGDVSGIQITPAEIPVDVAEDITAVAVDVNGVVLGEVKYSDNNNDYLFEIESQDAAYELTGDGKLKMTEIGTKVNVKVTYNTNELTADGDLKTYSEEQTIVAVAAANISGYDKVAFFMYDQIFWVNDSKADEYFETTSYDDIMKGDIWWAARDKVRVMAAGTPFYLTALVTDDAGYERANGSLTKAGYTLESADDTYLIVEGDKLTGVREGSTYVLVKKDGEVLFPIPVEVQAMSKLTTISVDKSSVVVSAGDYQDAAPVAGDFKGATPAITITAKDQYGEDYKATEVEDAGMANNHEYMFKEGTHFSVNKDGWNVFGLTVDDPDNWEGNAPEGQEVVAPGSSRVNSYTITVKDTVNTEIALKKTVSVNVKRPLPTIKDLGLSVNDGSSIGTEDTVLVNKDEHIADASKTVSIKLACYDSNNVFIKYEELPTQAAFGKTTTIELKKGNVDTTEKYVSDEVKLEGITVGTTNAGVASYSFVSRTVGEDDNSVQNVVAKAAPSPYRISVKGVALDGEGNVIYGQEKYETLSATITVKDTQKGITTNQEVKSLDDISPANKYADVLRKSISVKAEDARQTTHKYDPKDDTSLYNFASVDAKVNQGSVAFTKVKVYVPYGDGATTVYLPVDVNVNYTVTKK